MVTSKEAARKARSLPAAEVTVQLWLRAWREFFPGERIEATIIHDDYMLEPFVRDHGRLRMRDVTRLMAQEWAVGHRSQVRYLRRVWGRARAVGLVTENVWDDVELPPTQRRPTAPPSLEQLDGILVGARARGGWWLGFADMAEVAAFSGARLGGLAGLRHGDVDLEARRMVVTEKGGKTRVIALAPRAGAALERRIAARDYGPGTLVFVSKLRRPLERSAVGEAWREIRGDFAGTFHSLKHFAGTWLASLGVDERDIAVQLGHVDSQGRPYTHHVRRVYVHPDNADALARVEEAAHAG